MDVRRSAGDGNKESPAALAIPPNVGAQHAAPNACDEAWANITRCSIGFGSVSDRPLPDSVDEPPKEVLDAHNPHPRPCHDPVTPNRSIDRERPVFQRWCKMSPDAEAPHPELCGAADDQTRHRWAMTVANPSNTLPTLILASKSPRRREIICALGGSIEITSSDVVEDGPYPGEPPDRYASRLAETKARAATEGRRDGILIGADTVVTLDGEILGKPISNSEAIDMLSRLRGRTHYVITAVCVLDTATGRSVSDAGCTAVTMRDYSDDEIEDYVASGEPMDKAGAYGVQDRVFRPAELVDGCYLNVVGLPLCTVVDLLRRFGVPARVRPGWEPPAGCQACDIPDLADNDASAIVCGRASDLDRRLSPAPETTPGGVSRP